jgi:hypothetical protein
MPEVCHFYGIKVYVYFRDHAPPHIHVEYVGNWAILIIENGRIYAGKLPRHTLTIVRHWMRKHRADLMTAWDLAERGEDPGEIDPPGKKGKR